MFFVLPSARLLRRIPAPGRKQGFSAPVGRWSHPPLTYPPLLEMACGGSAAHARLGGGQPPVEARTRAGTASWRTRQVPQAT
jgi:hypothetical protein